MLFGVVQDKDSVGMCADTVTTPVIECIRQLRVEMPGLLLSCDVCLCEYTDHGHCGILRSIGEELIIDNQETVKRLASIALAYAQAGAQMICPLI